MPLDPEALYVQLGRLVEAMPDLSHHNQSQELNMWLGRAFALVEQTKDGPDIGAFRAATGSLFDQTYAIRDKARTTIKDVLYRRLCVAELNAPVSAQGAFIPAGNAFDAMAAVGKVLKPATKDVLIVDPYMDEKALTDFASLAAETCHIRLLADQNSRKLTLKPAVERWLAQYTTVRPLQALLAAPRVLHDRLIIVDNLTAWVLTQSLNAFATRSPASIVRVDAETAKLKVDAYQDIWNAATPI